MPRPALGEGRARPGAGARGSVLRALREAAAPGRRGAALGVRAFAGVQGAVLSLPRRRRARDGRLRRDLGGPEPTPAIGWRALGVGRRGRCGCSGRAASSRPAARRSTLVPLGLTRCWSCSRCYASARRSAHPEVARVGRRRSAGTSPWSRVVLVAVGRAGPLGVGAGAVGRTLVGAAGSRRVGLGTRAWGGAGWCAGGSRAMPAASPRGVLAASARASPGPPRWSWSASGVVLLWALAGQAPSGDVLAALDTDTFGARVDRRRADGAGAQPRGVGGVLAHRHRVRGRRGHAPGAGRACSAARCRRCRCSAPCPRSPAGRWCGPRPSSWRWGCWPALAAPDHARARGVAAARRRGGRRRAARRSCSAGWPRRRAGAAGPGRMAVVGPSPVLVALDGAGWLLLGALAAVPGSPLVRRAAAAAVRRAWGRARAGRRGRRPAGR